MSRNDSVSGKNTEQYKSNWDKIFGKKKDEEKRSDGKDNEDDTKLPESEATGSGRKGTGTRSK